MITITKTLPCIRMKGSLTVEAAVIMPFVVLFLTLFLGLFRVELVEMQVNQALGYAVSELAIHAEEVLPQQLLAKKLFINELKEQGCKEVYIKNGWSGFTLGLTERDEIIQLKVDYQICLPMNLFGKQAISVTQSATARKWTGRKETTAQSDQWVYVTPYGVAYHKSSACPYLDLSVWAVTRAHISTIRNQNGGIYDACNVCIKNVGDPADTIYVTDYGDLYHGSLSCSRLKRMVYRTSKEMVAGRSPCQKCYGVFK